MLDEVDAALDATNVARVAHYIRNCTRENNRAGTGPDTDAARGGGSDSSKRQRRSAGDAGAAADSSGAAGDQQEGGGRRGDGGGLESFQSIVISLKDIFYEKVLCVCWGVRGVDTHGVQAGGDPKGSRQIGGCCGAITTVAGLLAVGRAPQPCVQCQHTCLPAQAGLL